MEFLFTKLKRHAIEIEEHSEAFTDYHTCCLNHSFATFEKYYTKIDETPFYAAAVALHLYKRFG